MTPIIVRSSTSHNRIVLSTTKAINVPSGLKAIEEIHDGFKLAEKDLSMRGPGEFFGTRQSGLPDLKMARISDVTLLEKARSEANCLFQKDPELVMPEHRRLNMELARIWPLEGSERS